MKIRNHRLADNNNDNIAFVASPHVTAALRKWRRLTALRTMLGHRNGVV